MECPLNYLHKNLVKFLMKKILSKMNKISKIIVIGVDREVTGLDDELAWMVKEAKSGDKEVLISLIMRRKQDYYRLAYTYMQNQEDALDALEDMILKVYENIRKLKDPDSFYSWSKTILVNCCRTNLRRKDRVLLRREVPEGSADDVFSGIDEQVDMAEHWEKLNRKHREVLRLRYYLDMDYQAIAKLLKIPLGTVKSRIHAGLLKLKESMGVSKG